MSGTLHFTSAMVRSGTDAVITPDKHGYRPMLVGALNAHNTKGDFYVYDEAVKLFMPGSALMDRIDAGSLTGEWGHPVYDPTRPVSEFIERLYRIDKDRECVYFKSLTIDKDHWKDNPAMEKGAVAIFAELKPFGPLKECLKDALEDPAQNVSFSIRSLSKVRETPSGDINLLKMVRTFDAVEMGGIPSSSKFSSLRPTTEGMIDDLYDMHIPREIIRQAAEAVLSSSVTLESDRNDMLEVAKIYELVTATSDISNPVWDI